MYKGVKVRYRQLNKYFTKTLKFENGELPEAVKDDKFDINYKSLEKWIFGQIPQRVKFLGYTLITA